MAINPADLYTGKVTAPSADYPLGSARDVTAPGSGDGTPFVASLVNDTWGFYQALLAEATITASGTPETAVASQYLESLKAITRGELATESEPGTIQLDDSFKATVDDYGLIKQSADFAASTDDYGLVKANRYQIKLPDSNITSNENTIPGLTFNNLVEGQKYRLTINGYFTVAPDDGLVSLSCSYDIGSICTLSCGNASSSGTASYSMTTNIIFTGTNQSSMTFKSTSVGAGTSINTNGTTGQTFVMLEELNNYVETTDFT